MRSYRTWTCLGMTSQSSALIREDNVASILRNPATWATVVIIAMIFIGIAVAIVKEEEFQ